MLLDISFELLDINRNFLYVLIILFTFATYKNHKTY